MSEKKQYHLTNLDCADCANTFAKLAAKVPGVESAEVNFMTATLDISGPGDLELLKGRAALFGIGIEEIADNLEQKQCQSGINKRLYWQAAISGILFLVAILGSQVFQQQVFYFLLPVAALVGGWFNFKKGFLNLISWRFDTSVLMSLAVVGAFAINQWEEAALLAFLFAIAEILESYTANRARQSIAQLIDEQPEKALLLTEAGEKEIAAKDVLPGQILLLRAGEKVPVDALVVEGNSYIQQSAITGEPLPREVAPGDKLYSGSLNEQGVLKIEALEKAQDSTMSKIIQLVEEAQGHKSQFQGMIERFAAIYTPIVLVLAIIVALIPPLFLGDWLAWIYRGLTLLVISCPCALVITSPVVLVSAISNGARNGILIKGGNYLERLAGVKIAAFDKTGTLSLGKPQVEAVLNYDFDEKEALSLALALEKSSKHPLAEALRQYCHDEGILEDDSLLDLQNIPGKGTKGKKDGADIFLGNRRLYEKLPLQVEEDCRSMEEKGFSIALLGDGEKIFALLTFSDRIKQEAASVLSDMRDFDLQQICILSGDSAASVANFSNDLGADQVYGGLLPADKVDKIVELQKYGPVLMVGDGINDAPALAAADISMAMGAAGSAAALEAADIALLDDNLQKIPFALALAKRSVAVIRQNIIFSLALKVLVIFAVFPGWLSLWLAILSDMGANIIVTLNGMRLANYKYKKKDK